MTSRDKNIDTAAIARQRCAKLLDMAAATVKRDPLLAKRYVKLARAIAMGHRLPLDRNRYCAGCDMPLVPGRTSRVRLDSKNRRVTTECLACGYKRGHGYDAKQKTPKTRRAKIHKPRRENA